LPAVTCGMHTNSLTVSWVIWMFCGTNPLSQQGTFTYCPNSERGHTAYLVLLWVLLLVCCMWHITLFFQLL